MKAKRIRGPGIGLALWLAGAGCGLFAPEQTPAEQAAAVFQEGLLHLKAGKLEPANAAFARACQLDPSKGEYYLQQGFALLLAEEPGQAIMSFARASELLPTQAEPEWQLGQVYEKLGKPQPALDHFEKAAARDQNDARIPKRLVALYLQANRLPDADRAIRKLRQLLPADSEIIALQAEVQDREGNAEQAVTSLTQALSQVPASDPQRPRLHLTLGRLLVKRGDQEGAVREFENALQGRADDAGILMDLGHALLGLDRVGDAIARFQQVIDRNPSDARAFLGLARAYLAKGEHAKAMEVSDTAITLRPTLVEAHVIAGEIQAKLGAHPDAVRSFKRAIDLDPTAPAARVRLAQLYRTLGQQENAIAELETALTLAPKESDSKRMLIALYVESGTHLDSALQFVDELLHDAARGRDLEMIKLKARILVLRQEFDRALQLIDQELQRTGEEDLKILRAQVVASRKATVSRRMPGRKGPEIIRLDAE